MSLTVSDLNIEKQLLYYILTSEKHAATAIDKIDSNSVFYDENCRKLFVQIKKYYGRYLKAPTCDVLEDIFSSIYDDKDKYQEFKLFIKHIYAEKYPDTDYQYVFDKIMYLSMCRRVISTLESNQALSVADLHEAHDKLEDAVLSVSKAVKISNFRKIEINEALPDRLAYYDKKAHLPKGIASGIDKLDELTGGWRPGELIVLVASPGEGKSTLLLNFAENANKLSGINVGMASLEMSYEETMERYHSMITKVPYHKIRNRLLTDEEKKTYLRRMCLRLINASDKLKFKEWFRKVDVNTVNFDDLDTEIRNKFSVRKEKFFVFDIPRGCTPSIIEMEIKNILKKQDCPLFIIDHLNVMDPTLRTKDHWMDLGMMARQLKGIARDYKITILTAAQLGVIKPGEKITTDNVKYAKKISEEADYVIGFKISEEDKLLNRIRLELTKHRHTQESVISIKKQFENMKIDNYQEIAEDEQS